MGLFSNPLSEPLSGNKIFAIILYLGLAGISIWATAESINSSFGVGKFISYTIGLFVIFSLGFLLSIIQTAFIERKGLTFLFVMLFFLLGWAFTCTTNAHKLFTQLKLEDIRKHEMDLASTELSNLSVSALTIGNNVVSDFIEESNGLIRQVVEEIENSSNDGFGEVAKMKLDECRQYIGISQDIHPKSRNSSKQIARDMETTLRGYLGSIVESKQDALNAISQECDTEDNRNLILKELAECKDTYGEQILSKECREKLSNAHEYYDKAYKCINDKLDIIRSEQKIKPKLSIPLASRELEKFTELYPFVKQYPAYKPTFYMAFLAAFLIDAIMFIILYFFILKSEN